MGRGQARELGPPARAPAYEVNPALGPWRVQRHAEIMTACSLVKSRGLAKVILKFTWKNKQAKKPRKNFKLSLLREIGCVGS